MSERTPAEQVLDVVGEFGFGDGLINTDELDALRIAAEVVALRCAVETLGDWLTDLDPHPSEDICDYLTDEAEQAAVRRALSTPASTAEVDR